MILIKVVDDVCLIHNENDLTTRENKFLNNY